MRRTGTAIVLATTLGGCAGSMTNVAPLPPAAFTELGKTSASACGFLLFDVFPIGVNDRTGRAYARAVDRVSASSLTDTTVEETWQYVVIGTVLCSEVSGTGIQASSGEPPKPLPESEGEIQKRPSDEVAPIEPEPEGEPLDGLQGAPAEEVPEDELTEEVPEG